MREAKTAMRRNIAVFTYKTEKLHLIKDGAFMAVSLIMGFINHNNQS